MFMSDTYDDVSEFEFGCWICSSLSFTNSLFDPRRTQLGVPDLIHQESLPTADCKVR